MEIHNKKFKERQEEKKAAFEALAEKTMMQQILNLSMVEKWLMLFLSDSRF